MSGPLAHLRVLDCTRLLPGGYCTMLLADLGADVLKIEEPGRGDYVRWMPPIADGVSAGHLALNRGKRSMTLNLKHPEGISILKRLAAEADVLVESFRPGVMDRLGVGYEAMRAVNPRLVWCAITGYGQDGPYRDRAGHDLNYIGYAGVLGLTGARGGAPAIPPVQIGDVGGGALMATVGILAALAERERTGEGRFVDVSMLDGVASWLSIHAQAFLMSGEEPARGAMRLSGGLACYQVYECADGRWLTLGALEPQFWRAFCGAVGLDELIEAQYDEARQEEMRARVQEVLLRESRDEWMRRLEHLDACVGPVNEMGEAMQDPQLRARGMIAEVAGTPTIGSPIRLTGSEQPVLRPAPGFGEHTAEVLAQLGIDESDAARLRAAGVVGAAPKPEG